MATFESSEKLVEVLGGFFNHLSDTASISDKMLKTDLVFRLEYTDPDAVIVVDCSGDKVDVRPGDIETEAVITMSMAADLGHKFWMGKLNLAMALTRRKIKAKGPIPKILKLLPVVKPAYAMYPKYLDSNGFGAYKL